MGWSGAWLIPLLSALPEKSLGNMLTGILLDISLALLASPVLLDSDITGVAKLVGIGEVFKADVPEVLRVSLLIRLISISDTLGLPESYGGVFNIGIV